MKTLNKQLSIFSDKEIAKTNIDRNISVFLAPTYDLAKQFAEEHHIDASVEAEYGQEVVEGDITLAHHGPRSNNPAPCNTEVGPATVDTVLVSHLDLDTIGGIMALEGTKPNDKEFWQAAEFIDVKGPHHIHELSEDVQDKLNAIWACRAEKDRTRPDRTIVSDVTDTYKDYTNDVQMVLDPERNRELIEKGREWAGKGHQEIESKLKYEKNGYRVFSTDGVFCSAAYYSPEKESVQKATIVYNERFKSITLAFENGGKDVAANKLMQDIFGPEAGGRAGIAGTPRGVEYTFEDTEKVAVELDKIFAKEQTLGTIESNGKAYGTIQTAKGNELDALINNAKQRSATDKAHISSSPKKDNNPGESR